MPNAIQTSQTYNLTVRSFPGHEITLKLMPLIVWHWVGLRGRVVCSRSIRRVSIPSALRACSGKPNKRSHSIDVPSQAFMDVSSVDNPALDYGAVGILGLGFTSLSTIDALVNTTGASTGRSLLYNLFLDNPNEPNFIAFSLSRSTDTNDTADGLFTIGACTHTLNRHQL